MWDNCTVDGGHRARFVNRAKAQLLLETLCDTPPAPICSGQHHAAAEAEEDVLDEP